MRIRKLKLCCSILLKRKKGGNPWLRMRKRKLSRARAGKRGKSKRRKVQVALLREAEGNPKRGEKGAKNHPRLLPVVRLLE